MGKIDGRTARRVQQRAQQSSGWTKAKRTLFLRTLAETCNVRASARAAGLTAHSAYELRQRDGEFAALWAAAMETGYVRLEAALLHKAMGAPQSDNPALQDVVGTERTPDGEIDVDLAVKLLARHRELGAGTARRGGMPLRQPTEQEVYKALERKVTAIERRLEQRK